MIQESFLSVAPLLSGSGDLSDLGEIIDVDSEIALKAAELHALSRRNYRKTFY